VETVSGLSSGRGAGRAGRPRRQRSVTELVASIVLGFETVVVFLAALVIFGLKALPPAPALIGGAVFCLALFAAIGLLHTRAGIILGWVLQAAIVATGIFVPAMFVVGILFVAIWVYAMYAGGRIDRRNNSHNTLETE